MDQRTPSIASFEEVIASPELYIDTEMLKGIKNLWAHDVITYWCCAGHAKTHWHTAYVAYQFHPSFTMYMRKAGFCCSEVKLWTETGYNYAWSTRPFWKEFHKNQQDRDAFLKALESYS